MCKTPSIALGNACVHTPAPAKIPKRVYKVGTLEYTVKGLVVLFAWLLWGDFCFTLFESIFFRFIPLYMKDIGASNALIGIMAGSVSGILTVLFLPHISMVGDRYRTRWGRRIPFLLWTTPCTVIVLVLIGYAPEIGIWFHAKAISPIFTISETTVVLTVLCLFIVMYHFFNMVLNNMFSCFLRDVVPQEVMARFLATSRIAGSLGGFVFSWYLFPHVLVYRKAMCVGVGLLYMISFFMMCWRVKEGKYEAPPPRENSPGIVRSFVVYFRDYLSVPIYRNFSLVYILMVSGLMCANPFLVLFARNTLGISMEDMGKVFAWGSAATMIAYLPVGWLCDRFNPMQIILASMLGLAGTTALAYVAVNGKISWLLYSLVFTLPYAGWSLAGSAVMMALFPSKNFGQFFSGFNILGQGGMILGNYLVGHFIDMCHSNYRLVFLWSVVCFVTAIVPMFMVYRGWIKHGGPDHYIPPMPHHADDDLRLRGGAS